jgi:hypothetical protein
MSTKEVNDGLYNVLDVISEAGRGYHLSGEDTERIVIRSVYTIQEEIKQC